MAIFHLLSLNHRSGDGFMLNMLTVIQMLNQKVKVEKVDPFYPFHPNARTPKLTDETRLLLAPGDADNWVEKGLPALVIANWKEVCVCFNIYVQMRWCFNLCLCWE